MNTSRAYARIGWSLVCAFAISACGRHEAAIVIPAESGLRTWALPAPTGSAQPDLALAPDGRILLSWLNARQGRRTQLQYADYSGDGVWSPVKTVAIGNSFVVNWADTPHIAASGDGALWMQWPQRPAAQPGAQWIMLSTSRDDGTHWSTPVRVHEADTGQQGFAALFAVGSDRMGVAWIGGAEGASANALSPAAADPTASAPASAQHAHAVDAEASATLQSAVFDAGLRRDTPQTVASPVCECCQPAAAPTADGTLLLYRARNEGVRDIHAARAVGTQWQAPVRVHADGWRIDACPVNGPALAAFGSSAYAAWYTGANNAPALRLARSDNGGAAFSTPVLVDQGPQVLGRAQVAMQGDHVWVAWLREEAQGQSLWLARYPKDLSRESARTRIALVAARGSASGMPKLIARDNAAYLVWTDVVDGAPALRGARYAP